MKSADKAKSDIDDIRNSSRSSGSSGNPMFNKKEVIDVKFDELEEDNESHAGKHVSPLVSIFVSYPVTIFAFIVALSFLCTYFVVPYFDLSDPIAGLRLRDDDYARRADAWIVSTLGSFDFWKEESGKSGILVIPERTTNANGRNLVVMYQTEDNAFTPERLQFMADLEEQLLAVEGWDEFCLASVVNGECVEHRSAINNLIGNNFTTQEEINEVLLNAWNTSRGDYLFLFSEEFNPDKNQLASRATQLIIEIGFPLKGYKTFEDNEAEQDLKVNQFLHKKGGVSDILRENEQKFGIRLVYGQPELLRNLGEEQIFKDVQNCFYAVAGIFIVMLLHMRSFFLASLGIMQIILSFPVAFFIYRIILGLELFGALHCLAIFVILGVGADDCFIYIDSFKHTSHFGWDLEKRVSFAYDKAKFTMAVTTFTNAFAFLSLSTSALPMVRYFGIFSFLLIIANYVLVMTMFTCIIVMWAKYVAVDVKSLSCKPKQKDEVTAISHYSAEQSESTDDKVKLKKSSLFEKSRSALISDKTNKIILVSFAIVTAIFFGLCFQLKLSANLNQLALFWPDDHIIMKYYTEYPWLFQDTPSSSGHLFHIVSGGINQPFIDRLDTNVADPKDLGKVLYEDGFELSSPQMQEWFSSTCKEVYNPKYDQNRILARGSGSNSAFCFMLAFQLWREARSETFPVPFANPVQPDIDIPFPADATTDEDTVEELLVEFFKRPFFEPFRQQVHFQRGIKSDSVDIAFQSFLVDAKIDDDYEKRIEVSEEWDKVMEAILDDKPSLTTGKPFYTEGRYFVDMQRQRILLVTAFASLAFAVIIAMGFMIMATNNWKITLLTLLCISGIIIVMLGFISLLQWEINAIVSISITVLVGFAVDYVVHFAVSFDEAYREKGIIDRKDKTAFALTTMGGSILAGASSTLIAAVMLFPTVIKFFSTFGTFLGTAVAVAIIFASIFLPAALARYGPDGGDGLISARLEKKFFSGESLYSENAHQPISKKKKKTFIGIYVSIFLICLVVNCVMWAFRAELIFHTPEPVEQDSVFPISDASLKFAGMKENSWYRINGGGNSSCADGSDYSFFVKKGVNTSNVIIEFQNGEICWNLATCTPKKSGSPISMSVDGISGFFDLVRRRERQAKGMMDSNGALADSHYIFVPMCTGDFHWGSKTTQYSENVVVNHRGAANVVTVLDWIFQQTDDKFDNNTSTLENLAVTGTDSGAYGSILYSGIIASWLQFTNSDIHLTQFGDGGLGLFNPDFFEEIVDAWGLNIDELRAFILDDGSEGSIPSWLVVPDELNSFRNFSNSFVNDTLFRECLENANQEVTLGQFNDFINGDLPESFEDCLLNSTLNSTASDFPFVLNGTLFNQTQNGGSFTFGNVNFTFGENSFNNEILNELFNTQECADEGAQVDGVIECVNFTILESLNLTIDGFNVSDFTSFETDGNAQLIPSMYLFFSYRFPEYQFTQISSAFDYTQTATLASTFLGELTPVSANEQKLWSYFMFLLYDTYLPFMPDNYYHFTEYGDIHGYLSHNRFYRVRENQFYQIMYQTINELPLGGNFSTRFDCRDENGCNSTGFDDRPEVLYF